VTMKMGSSPSPASSPSTSPSGRRRSSPGPFVVPEETPWGIPGKPHIVTKVQADKEEALAAQEKETFRKKLLAEEKRQETERGSREKVEIINFKSLQDARKEKEKRRQRHSKEQRELLHQRFLEGEAQVGNLRTPHIDFCSSVSYTQPRTSSPQSRRPPASFRSMGTTSPNRDMRDSFRSIALTDR